MKEKSTELLKAIIESCRKWNDKSLDAEEYKIWKEAYKKRGIEASKELRSRKANKSVYKGVPASLKAELDSLRSHIPSKTQAIKEVKVKYIPPIMHKNRNEQLLMF